jgi:hypothetical protein
MATTGEKSMVNVGVINAENIISVSKDIAPVVKIASVNGNVVPLFPTKNGCEYFVFKTVGKTRV